MFVPDPTNELIWGIFHPIIFSGLLSSIVTLVITLLVTYLQNTAYDKRQKDLIDSQTDQQKQRLEFEADQEKIDREMNLRKDIYLAGAEALGKMHNYIISFSEVQIDKINQKEIFHGVGETMNKLYIVADATTIKSLIELQDKFGEYIRSLIEKRQSIDWNLADRKMIESQIQALDDQIKNNSIIINNLSEKPNFQPNSQLITDQNNLIIQRNNLYTTWVELTLLGGTLIAEIYNLAFQYCMDFQVFAAKTNIEIRREIDLPIKPDEYLDLVIESNKQASIAHKEFYSRVDEAERNRFKSFHIRQN